MKPIIGFAAPVNLAEAPAINSRTAITPETEMRARIENSIEWLNNGLFITRVLAQTESGRKQERVAGWINATEKLVEYLQEQHEIAVGMESEAKQ